MRRRQFSGMLATVLLAITVPAMNLRGPMYMDQALAGIHQANPERHSISFLLARLGESVALFCRVPEELRAIVEAQIYAQYPDCRINELPDTAIGPPASSPVWVADLRLDPDLFPMKRYLQFDDAINRTTADPLTPLLTVLARDKSHQVRSFIEIKVKPASNRRRERYLRCIRRLARPFFRSHPRLSHVYVHLATSRHFIPRLAGWLLGRLAKHEADHGPHDPLHMSSGHAHEREQDIQAASDKLGRLLFETHLRVLVFGDGVGEGQAIQKLRQIIGAFGIFHSPGLSSFHVRHARCQKAISRKWTRYGFLLSTEELATIWHPATLAVRAPTMSVVMSRELESPAELPTPAPGSELAILGHAVFRGRRQRFGILPDDRRRHALLLGKTGMGKSTLLQRLVESDIAENRGCGLIDPHGDLAEAVLRSAPAARTNDIILLDTGDTTHPISFNVLNCPRREDRPLVVSGIISSFKKIFGVSWGNRMEHFMRNALLALLETPGTSLVSLARFLSDRRFREGVLTHVTDPAVLSVWQQEYAHMAPKLQAEAVSPIQNKVGQFVSSPLLRNILGQSRSTLDLRRAMDEGKILIVNLGKGRIGDDASALLGSFLVTAVQIAAMSRANVAEKDRRDFYLYVDEFQNFATDSFATILSEARKYRLGITIANQYLAQMEEQTLHAVFGNVGTIVSFQVGAQDSELVAEQLGGDLTKQDLLSLPRYQAYVRLLINGMPSRPFNMHTLPPARSSNDPDRPTMIRRASRHRYARPVKEVEQEIRSAFTTV